MAIRYVNEVPGCPAPHSPYSNASVANGFVFVSGQIGGAPGAAIPDERAAMREQTTEALRRVQAVLEGAGSSVERIVKVTVLSARDDFELFKEMNAAYGAFFTGPKPARAVAQLGVRIPGILVSIEAVALAG